MNGKEDGEQKCESEKKVEIWLNREEGRELKRERQREKGRQHK